MSFPDFLQLSVYEDHDDEQDEEAVEGEQSLSQVHGDATQGPHYITLHGCVDFLLHRSKQKFVFVDGGGIFVPPISV